MFESVKSIANIPRVFLKRTHFRLLRRGKLKAAAFCATLPQLLTAIFISIAAAQWHIEGMRSNTLVILKDLYAILFIGIWILYWWMKFDWYKVKRSKK